MRFSYITPFLVHSYNLWPLKNNMKSYFTEYVSRKLKKNLGRRHDKVSHAAIILLQISRL
jgi:hypothetical protein